MHISDFTYSLPEQLIATEPPEHRGQSRLLVLGRHKQQIVDDYYKNLPNYLKPGDLIVLNDTKVIKARLLAQNASGKQRELLLLEDHHETNFKKRKCLYRGNIKAGEQLKVGASTVVVNEIIGGGIAEIESDVSLLDLAENNGTVPLPPYIHREATAKDTDRYQTVFAKNPGSVAAPTASLNFTDELKDQLKNNGVEIAYLTLHVGLGTFLPIRSDEVENHKMHSEYFEIPASTVSAIQKAKRIIAIGTTVARTLEYSHQELKKPPKNISGEADIFIYPGYDFKIIDGLVTNFHAPKSTVLMLAAAFADWDNLMQAYSHAIDNKYAFLSYGDSMLIL